MIFRKQDRNRSTPPTTPFARSYWVIPGRLLAGAFPGAKHEAEASSESSKPSSTPASAAS